jgi:L-lactate permease
VCACAHTTAQVAAERIGSSVTGMLAVQVAGATIGNMICINNILSAKAVMNMAHVPGVCVCVRVRVRVVFF